MPKNDTTTKFKADISQLKTAMQDAARQVRLANSEFKAATAGMNDWSKSADGLSAKTTQLNKVLDAQKKQLSALEDQYALVVKEQGTDSKGAEELKIKINNQKAAVEKTKKELGEYEDALRNVENQTDETEQETKELTEATGKANDGFTVMKGTLSDLVSYGIQKAIEGLKNLTGAAKEAWVEFDSGADNIIKLTGATGENAKALTETYKKVAKSINADMGDIGMAIGEVNTKFGVTGDDLEELSTLFLKFADINGTDVTLSIDSAQKAMAAYGIQTEDTADFLDRITATSQATGVSTDKLASGIVSNATAFQELGLTVDQAVLLMGQLEKSGANSETVLNGMRKALKSSAKDGKDMKTALSELQKTIENSKSSTEGLNAAYDLFGKSGDQIYGAIKNGTLNFNQLGEAATDVSGTINRTFDETLDAPDRLKLAVQGLKVDMADTVQDLMTKYEPDIKKAIQNISKALQKFIPKVKDLITFIEKHGPQIKAILIGIGTAFLAFKISGIIIALTSALSALFAAVAAGTPIITALMAALNMNPISLLIGAIAGLVAAFIYLWNTSEDFRNFFIGMWEAIKETVGEYCKAIADFFLGAWDKIKKAWDAVIGFFKGIWKGIKDAFNGASEWLSNLFESAWKKIKEVWNGAKSFFSGIWGGIKGAFDGASDWLSDVFEKASMKTKAAWKGIKGFFSGIWEGIKEVFKDVGSWFSKIFTNAKDSVKVIFDALVEVIKAPINLLIDGLNVFIRGLNKIKIPDWVPAVGGKGLHFNELNKLAQGGVLKRGQVGILEGSGAEAVVPLERNKQWIAKVVDEFRKQIDLSDLKVNVNINPGTSGGSSGTTGHNSQTTNMTFNQYNNSPKALDRLSIYRETNSLLFAAKVRMSNV